MVAYQGIFHPVTLIVGSGLAIVYREWVTLERDLGTLATWTVVMVAVSFVSLVPVLGLLAISPHSLLELSNKGLWYHDIVSVSCLFIADGLLRYLSIRFHVGVELQQLSRALAVAAVPYGLLSLVWDVSGHVTFTLVPVVFLGTIDRRFWVLLPIPVVMVANRPLVGVHSWKQSLVGFAIGAIVVCLLWRRRSPRVGQSSQVGHVGTED